MRCWMFIGILLLWGCDVGTRSPAQVPGCDTSVPAIVEFWMCASPWEIDIAQVSPDGDSSFIWMPVADPERWLGENWLELASDPEELRGEGFLVRIGDDGGLYLLLANDEGATMRRTADGPKWGVADARMERPAGKPIPVFQLDAEGTRLFEDFTERAVEALRAVAILINGEVVRAGSLRSVPVRDGRGVVQGVYTRDEAACMAERLQ